MAVQLAPRTGLIGKPLANGLLLPPDLTLDEWAAALHHADMIVESSPWWVADLMAYGEAHFGQQHTQALPTDQEDPTGVKQSRLKQAAWMAQKYPRNQRISGLSYTHHRAAAELEPDERQALLHEAAQSGWSTRELIAVVKAKQEAERRAIDAPSEPVCAAEDSSAWMPTPDDLTDEAAARMRFEMTMRGVKDAAAFGAGFCSALAWLEALDCFSRDDQ